MGNSSPLFLGIDVGGTNIKVGLTDDVGTVLASTHVDTLAEVSLEAGLDNMEKAIHHVLSEMMVTIDQIKGIGMVCPGPMDIKAGRLANLTNLPTWRYAPIRDLVGERLGRPVVLQNDANAAAYGEYWAGAAQQNDIMALITLGTGLGSGVVINGEILEGAHSRGAEYGYIIIQSDNGREHPEGGYHGVLEAYASSRAIITQCHHRLTSETIESTLRPIADAGEEITPLMIMQHAEAGDAFAHELIMEVAYYLGIGTVNVMHTINPEIILFGGAMTFGRTSTKTGRAFLARIQEEIKKRAFPIPRDRTIIEFAKLGGEAGFIGAAGCAKKAFSEAK